MNKIIRYVGLAIFALVARRVLRTLLIRGAVGAGGGASNPGFEQSHFAPMLEAIGGAQFVKDLALVAAGTLVYSLVLGYLARALLGERGFGPRLGALFALMGAWSALALHGFLFGVATGAHNVTGVTICGSFAFLFAAVAAKALATGGFASIPTWRELKVDAAYARALDAPPEGPSAERMRAMVSRASR